MVVRLVAAVVGRGGVLVVEDDELCCRLPAGTHLPNGLTAEISAHKAEILGALQAFSLGETVANIRALTPAERETNRIELAHDLAAWALAETPELAGSMVSGTDPAGGQ